MLAVSLFARLQARPCLRVGGRPPCRTQPRAWAAAASPAALNPDRGQPLQRLHQEVEDLKQLLQARRINKQLLANKVAVLAAVLAAVEAERQLAESELRAAEKDRQISELKMKALVAEYLFSQGSLHARGLIDYAEQQLFTFVSLRSRSRLEKWQQLGEQQPQLEAAILQANPSWRPQHIPDKVVALYSQLSGRAHAGDMSAVNCLLLVEGPLSREDLRFLKCVAVAVSCPCELRYRQVPDAAMAGEQPAAGAEGR